jgi:hypothetical protein
MLDEASELCDELGMPGLGARVAAVRRAPGPAPAVFRRDGDYWTLAFDGRTLQLRDVKGLRYIAALLARPGREVHAPELLAAANGGASEAAPPAEGAPILDDAAKASYARRWPSSRTSSSRRATGATPGARLASQRRSSS